MFHTCVIKIFSISANKEDYYKYYNLRYVEGKFQMQRLILRRAILKLLIYFCCKPQSSEYAFNKLCIKYQWFHCQIHGSCLNIITLLTKCANKVCHVLIENSRNAYV